MRLAVVLFTLLALVALRPAGAADVTVRPAALTTPQTLPFPRSERAQSVWASGLCSRECGAYCAEGMVGCLDRNAQGQCLKFTDRCDRYCQNQCRTQGGPLLPDLLDF
jgi:hypothetical protein